MTKTVGIDLGTTNSVVAVLEGGEPKVIANAEGANTTPSVVAFPKNSNDILVGQTARRQAVTNVDRTISSIKRHMGEKWTQKVDMKTYTPEEISARILMKLKKDAEAYLGDKVTDAVITVPAYFNDAQRKATQDAGKIAGLNVLRIVNEPTAAALAYGLEKANKDEKILVFDLGGGTYDVSLLEIGKDDSDGFSTIEVLATAGDNHLGGDDWDKKLTDYIVTEFKNLHSVDLSSDKIAMQRIVEAAEQAKKELSASTTTTVNLPYISMTPDGPLNLEIPITRAKFETITSDLLNRTKEPFQQVLNDAKLTVKDIDHVVLVGGSTRMPAVRELVTNLAGKEPNQGVNPDEVVAVGAALQGGVLTGERKDVLLIDVTPLTLGIRTNQDTMTPMIERNSAIPTQKAETFTTATDNQPAVTIMVSQGERPVFSGNKLLGQFDLEVAPARAGTPQIQVTFNIDANGVLEVTAKDLGTGKEKKVTITGGSNLSEDEINQAVKDAETHAAEDQQKMKEAETLNEAERLVRQAKETITEHSDRISADVKTQVEADTQNLEDLVAKKDTSAIPAAVTTLTVSLQKVGESVYSSQTQQTPNPETSGEGEEIVDAEIVD